MQASSYHATISFPQLQYVHSATSLSGPSISALKIEVCARKTAFVLDHSSFQLYLSLCSQFFLLPSPQGSVCIECMTFIGLEICHLRTLYKCVCAE